MHSCFYRWYKFYSCAMNNRNDLFHKKNSLQKKKKKKERKKIKEKIAITKTKKNY